MIHILNAFCADDDPNFSYTTHKKVQPYNIHHRYLIVNILHYSMLPNEEATINPAR